MCNITLLPCFESALTLCSCTLVVSRQEASYKPLISSMACSALGLQGDSASLCSSNQSWSQGTREGCTALCLPAQRVSEGSLPLMEKPELHPFVLQEKWQSTLQIYKFTRCILKYMSFLWNSFSSRQIWTFCYASSLSSMTEGSQFTLSNGYYWVSNSLFGSCKFTLENPNTWNMQGVSWGSRPTVQDLSQG